MKGREITHGGRQHRTERAFGECVHPRLPGVGSYPARFSYPVASRPARGASRRSSTRVAGLASPYARPERWFVQTSHRIQDRHNPDARDIPEPRSTEHSLSLDLNQVRRSRAEPTKMQSLTNETSDGREHLRCARKSVGIAASYHWRNSQRSEWPERQSLRMSSVSQLKYENQPTKPGNRGGI